MNEYYLKQLVKKWPGWNLERLKNRMYDVEKILSIDYISKQEKPEFCSKSKEEIVNDKIEKFEATLIVIKQSDRIFIKRTAYIPVESIIDYGEEVIQLLLDKPEYALPMEEEAYPCECIIIDTVQRHIIIDSSKFGLWEQNAMKWNDYNFTMGDYGRIETLKLAGLDVANLEMPMDKIREQFKGLVRQVDGFDPSKWANKLLKENNDIQFNPDFFDSVRPQKTSLEKMKERIKKILRVK
ncbi:MAG TPA: hypothetical protein VE978_05860 [Chitinophagales bacterium]|nr:hypothetical protein [Chitinophagales bacterium]